jgi:hypothetical protein
MPDWLIALSFGFLFIFIGVPIIAMIGLSIFDVLARRDIGVSRLVWLFVVLALPVLGSLIYWLFRPKDFDPLHETERQTILIGYPMNTVPLIVTEDRIEAPVGAPPIMRPALQGGADPEPEDAEPAA